MERAFCPQTGQRVISFTKVALPWGWLGNMAPYGIWWEGKYWRTAEALFQALRLPETSPVREAIRIAKSPMQAKMIAKKHRNERVVEPQSVPDLANMEQIVRLKVDQNLKSEEFRTLMKMLDRCEDPLIVEDCSSRPRGSGLFWGAMLQDAAENIWAGENRLGQIWMDLLRSRRLSQ